MSSLDRRKFLAGAAAGSIAAAVIDVRAALGQQPSNASPNERISLAFLGLGGRGTNLLGDFLARDDVEIPVLCDPDPNQHPELSDLVATKSGKRPQRFTDFRRALDDRSIDAVVIATPDHWHAPLTVAACQAGKDVYVEKPLSHNDWEGAKAVEAARKYHRIVQVGTQNRSAPYNVSALEYLRSGKLGRVPLVRVCNLKTGRPFKSSPDGTAPRGADYDLWLGPAPSRPFNPGRFHKTWHYHWDYSGGDMANDGIHQLDLARWLIGADQPLSAVCNGGNFAFMHDGNETPDTQVATFQFPDCTLVYEQIGYGDYSLKSDPEVRNGDLFPYWMQNSERIELYGTEGLMIVGRHGGGWQVFDRPQQRQPHVAAEQFGRFPDASHQTNFLDCVRSRNTPNADVLEGRRSATLVHLANISYRLGGRKLAWDAQRETIDGDSEAAAMLRRSDARSQFAVHEVV